MQPDPTAVSQHTPSLDSSQANTSSTQHGNDFDGRSVSGPLHYEVPGDSSGLDLPAPDADRPPLSDTGKAPPSSPVNRVSQYESAGTPGEKGAALAFRVVASTGQSNRPLESLPNGTRPRYPAEESLLTFFAQRFSRIYYRTCLRSPSRLSPWYPVGFTPWSLPLMPGESLSPGSSRVPRPRRTGVAL
jgi:hypothetical protein